MSDEKAFQPEGEPFSDGGGSAGLQFNALLHEAFGEEDREEFCELTEQITALDQEILCRVFGQECLDRVAEQWAISLATSEALTDTERAQFEAGIDYEVIDAPVSSQDEETRVVLATAALFELTYARLGNIMGFTVASVDTHRVVLERSVRKPDFTLGIPGKSETITFSAAERGTIKIERDPPTEVPEVRPQQLRQLLWALAGRYRELAAFNDADLRLRLLEDI